MPATHDPADPDPVVARYNVFLKPPLPAHQKLLVLQYPNRVNKCRGSPGLAGNPTELRVKGTSGMVEVDVPLDYSTAYDRSKGQAWGAALAQSTKAKAGGSHGLAGGFGVGGAQGSGRRGGGGGGGVANASSASSSASGPEAMAAAAAAAAEDAASGRFGAGSASSTASWSEAVRQDRVLRLQTLGGMCPPPRIAEAKWMIGVFDGGNLHLTPVSSLVHLRPQLHHIDAETEMERAKHRDGSLLSTPTAGPGSTAAARAIHMTIKSAGADGDEKMVTETMADRLRAVQMEPWARLAYVADDDEEAWAVFEDTFFLRGGAEVPPTAAQETLTAAPGETPSAEPEASLIDPALEDKGKAVAAAAAAAVPLVAQTRALRTAWTEDDMLQAISKIEKPKPAPAPATMELPARGGVPVTGAASTPVAATATTRGTGRPRGGAAAAAAAAAAVKQEDAAAPAPPPATTARRAATRGRGRGARAGGTGRGGSSMQVD